MHEFFLIAPGPRPMFYLVAEHLWGWRCSFDSDGNSDPLESNDWTELTLILRPAYIERVDIDPIGSASPLILWIRSESENLAYKAATFLQEKAGGTLRRTRPETPAGG